MLQKNRNIVAFIIYAFIIIANGCNSNEQSYKAFSWQENLQNKCTEQLKSILNDPKSYESVSWDLVGVDSNKYWDFKKLHPSYDGVLYKWKLINTYRAKNSFGGYIEGTAYFLIDSVDNIKYVREGYFPGYISP